VELSYSLSEADVLLSQAEAQKLCRAAMGRSWRNRLLLWSIGITFGLTFAASLAMFQSHPGKVAYDFSFVFFPACLGALAVLVYVKTAQVSARRAYLASIGPFPLHHALRLTDSTLELSGPDGSASLPLGRIVSCSENGSHVLITVRPWTVIAIPKVAIASAGASTSLVSQLSSRIGP
jgi:hypothetical protein